MRNLITIIAVVSAFLIVSSMDYEDEIREQAHYCKMVKNGHWPNYKKVNCNEK